MSVCHICLARPCLRESLYTCGLVSVSPSQKIKLYIDNHTHIETQKLCPTDSQMSIGSPSKLGQNGPFIWSLFEGQHKQLQQLKESNAFLQTQVADTHDDITNVASAMVSTVAQAIATNPQSSIPVHTSHNLTRSAKAADPEPFDGNQDQTKEFVRAIQIMVTMHANTFAEERMKILYILLFIHGGMAQVLAANETMAVITGTSQMQTLNIFLESVEKTFGDPDQAQTARTQLHELKTTPGTTAEDYTAQFEMLAGRTGFTAVCIIQGMRLFILKKKKSLVNTISPSILHGMI